MKSLIFILALISFFPLQGQVLVPEFFDHKSSVDKVHFIETDGIQIFIENLKISDQLFIFDLEVGNRTLHPIDLQHAEIYMLGSNIPFPTDDPLEVQDFESRLIWHPILKEDQVVESYTKEMKKLRQKRVALGVLAVGLMAFDIAMDVRDANRSEWSMKHQRNADMRKLATFVGYTATDVAMGNTGMDMYESGEDLHYLRNELFFLDVIQPRENQRGRVFFPKLQARYYRIIINIEGHEYAMDFRWAENRDLRRLRKVANGK